MIDNPKNLSEMLKSIVSGYDDIKSIHNQNILIEKNIFSVQTALENELKTSASYNERTKLKLDDINEKLANAKVFFDEIASNQAQVKALFTSINNLVIKEAALIKNVDSKISNYTELNAKNTELLAEIKAIKEAVALATKTYKNDCDLALKGLNESLTRANTLNESLAVKDVELKNTLESIESARTNCLVISNEIKEMRKRSQCLMSKAEDIFSKATWFENTLNEYIAKIQTLENNYNEAFVKNEELELKIKDSIDTLDKILIALNGRSLDEVLTELKTTNTTLQTAINTKSEIDTIKTNLEQVLAEQNTKLDNYYTKIESDELLDLVNNEIAKLQENKADKLELEPLKSDISNLTNNKANNTDLEPIKNNISNLANNKADKLDLNPIKNDISNLANTKANKSEVYTKTESNNLLNAKANNTDLNPIKNDISNLTNTKANKSEVYTKTESNNLLNAKANIGDLTKAKSDLEVRIKAVENDYVKVYDTPINVSVGTGGTYAKLSDAFKALMCYKKARANVGDCVITLLPNFVLNEQLTFDNVDLTHIRLISNNAVIKCEFAHEASANFAVFRFFHSKSCLFYRCKFDFTNKPQRLIQLGYNSSLRFCECSVNNSIYGIISYNGFADVRSCTFTNTIETCLYFTENANLNALTNTYDTSNRAIVSLRNTKLNSYRDIFKNIKLECFLVDWGGFAMYEAHPNGSFVNSPKKCNLVPNTLYKNGVFFDRTTSEQPIIQTDIPSGKMFKCNGINVIMLRNLKVVPTCTDAICTNSYTINKGYIKRYSFRYDFKLPVVGAFMVGMDRKGFFMSGQSFSYSIKDKEETTPGKDLKVQVNQLSEADALTFNIVAIGY
ncbi:hypothetical protein [Campylobacter sp. RM12637]|uniref:hypothetical protein n=1 Tax=Campylobacter sp. RM12637 TaxID=2735734 RepID=UPI0030149AEF|nr:hypothetical protein [Campylobacter sp. RM12637]